MMWLRLRATRKLDDVSGKLETRDNEHERAFALHSRVKLEVGIRIRRDYADSDLAFCIYLPG